MPIQTNASHDDGPTTLYDMQLNGCIPELSDQPTNIGWNLQQASADEQQQSAGGPSTQTASSFLTEVHVSHKRISNHFAELFTLFEDYRNIMRENEQAHPKLKRSQSEQFTASHLQPSDCDCHVRMKTSVSLTSMELTDLTLLDVPPKLTCEMASQTYWPNVSDGQQLHQPAAETQKRTRHQRYLDEQQQLLLGAGQAHTLHIEVESISSLTALQRAPLRQRLWQVLHGIRQTLVGGLTMLGENITYVMFVMLCLWCLYLIIGHYYSFIGNSVNRNYNLKPQIQHHARPKAAVPQTD